MIRPILNRYYYLLIDRNENRLNKIIKGKNLKFDIPLLFECFLITPLMFESDGVDDGDSFNFNFSFECSFNEGVETGETRFSSITISPGELGLFG